MHITNQDELGGYLAYQGYTTGFRCGVTRNRDGKMRITVYLQDANIHVDISAAEATELAYMLSSAAEAEMKEAA